MKTIGSTHHLSIRSNQQQGSKILQFVDHVEDRFSSVVALSVYQLQQVFMNKLLPLTAVHNGCVIDGR